MMNKLYSMLGIGKKAGFITSGETGCIQNMKKDKCKLLLLASDASDNTKDKFISLCNRKKIKYVIIGKKHELGGSIGKDIAATISITDDSFTKAVLNIIDIDAR
ncbi:ribosomal L7Ae/L30e/S12e/gadd45 family protein [Gottschalkia purinilytica]|uniref:Ribosomal L7Ae/L30e/S12e/gadd45 family protein n=1 Tax=Gottschalkia purinilytica TaxID=1503 RepID=A0A0L0WBK5_GOTPU|nr:ribosomal L7Ae/L30e/S12e/Gadd45 family protein [Gottschalkia purinilytica]KNF08861.1 ribosomal L7Ae/L30e/S12e/gadd45 family protein [Gottschalkia purinilytica]